MYFISAIIPTKSVTRVNGQFVTALTALSREGPALGGGCATAKMTQ